MATGTGRRGICLARASPRDRGLQDPQVEGSAIRRGIGNYSPGPGRASGLRSLLNYRLSSRQTMYPFQPFLPSYLFLPLPRSTARLVTLLRFSSANIASLLALEEGDWTGYLMGHRLNYDRPLLPLLPRSFVLSTTGSLLISREIPRSFSRERKFK